jgi:hypothetical protein
MALGFSPKQHRVRAKAARKGVEDFRKALKKDAKKHNCKAALAHFANAAFYTGMLRSEVRGSKKGAKVLSTARSLKASGAAKELRGALSDLSAACSIGKRRMAKK